jgi:predicted kinase
MLIVFGGLPGTGKSTLASALASRLRCAHVRIDAIGAALRRAGAVPDPIGLADYVIAEAIAEATLIAGATIVVDAVNPVEAARAAWRELARRCRVELRFIELVCNDGNEHRRRFESRPWEFAELKAPTWDEVLAREYEPWSEPRLTLDTTSAVAESLDRIMVYIDKNAAPEPPA